MIVTRQNRIPFLWLIMITIPWTLFFFMIMVGTLNMYILNRLVENPMTLTFLLSLPGLVFTFIPLSSYISYMSDRIWTRWGRRKIFLIISFTGSAIVYFCYPMASSIWTFLSLMFMGSLVGVFMGPFEALKLEIVPPAMRGRSAAINQWLSTIVQITFYGVVLGRFDEVMPFLGHQIAGIKLLYWCGSAGLVIVVYNYLFGIHEVQPKSAITGEKFSVQNVWAALTMPQLRYLYVFIIATAMLNTGLGIFGNLLYINQWGYSFQEMGVNVAVGGTLNLFLIPIVGFFADKGEKHRMRIWIFCLIMVNILTLSAFAYYTWYLPDQRPSLVEIIFFGETTCIFGILSSMVYYPLVYDYVPRNLMGTYSAGSGILQSIVGFLTSNGIGAFMFLWATTFQPPAGEMVRVCLDKQMKQPQVEQVLKTAGLSTSEGKKAGPRDIVAKPWYANGIVSDSGICYEIRLRDADSDAKRKRRDDLKNKTELLEAKIKQSRKHGASAEIIDKKEMELAKLENERTTLDSTLSRRAESWRQEVLRGLGDKVVKKGAELLSETPARAVAASIPTTSKAKAEVVDKLNKLLRAEKPSVIDLSMVSLGRGFGLSASSVLSSNEDSGKVINSICRSLTAIADKAAPGLLNAKSTPSSVVVRSAEVLDIPLVENPVRTFVSVISRGVNAVLSRFVVLPAADQKLISLSRNVCKGGPISHACATTLPGRNGVRLIVVPTEQNAGDMAAWTIAALDKIRTECASLKLTMLTPVVDKGVVPIRYNYLAGNIYTFMSVLLGFMMVAFFISKEKAGKVKKWGAIEAHAEKQQEKERKSAAKTQSATGPAASSEDADSGETYIPGYLVPKIIGALVGLAVLSLGIHEAWPGMRLFFAGEHAEAVAVSISAHKPGQADVTMHNQAELDVKMKEVSDAKDYHWTFYDNFTFETKSGSEVTFMRDVGCKLKPTMPLVDDNGLPTTAPVIYDPRNPAHAVLPMEYSTWLAPALTGFFGLVMFLVSLALALYARKPIRLSSADAVNLK